MSETPDQDIKQTPLHALHEELGAKMVPFAGYAMAVQYTGIIAEHQHTRQQASLFDVSHMGQAILRGENAIDVMETLVPSDLQNLAVGKTTYSVLTNASGGIIDDLMVSRAGDHLFLVVNASRKEYDFEHIGSHLGGSDCELEVMAERSLLALQGPAAAEVLARFAAPSRHMVFMTGENLNIADIPCFVSRSGYTGEDGFEISVPSEHADRLARLLLGEAEVRPAGLGARDSLRLEAGLCLYGNDIDENTTPVEAALSWVISRRRRAEGGFPGADVILRQIAEGVERKRVGLHPDGKAPARAHTEVMDRQGNPIGEVTSGGFGPSVGGPIAMGYVNIEQARPEVPIDFIVRRKALPGRVVRLPFVEHRYVKR
ncbi:MAG: glycine cleavage system aminomethyltransferase GcvT [Rhodospirillales bacterium]|nr:glycine cleavage system aminomethyltransferase GcvT [Rhodospirillales bacterium]MDP6774789.1 glycine cleavage system aminomethyltransferase GcvT [Rhodospirillales bacterium]